jgi:hypothetical protein
MCKKIFLVFNNNCSFPVLCCLFSSVFFCDPQLGSSDGRCSYLKKKRIHERYAA